MNTSITASDLYQRQITLLGSEAQEKIQRSRILVIGAGGLGCPALQYLASAGVGEIGIVDYDLVSVSNLQRQILFDTADIGRPKIEVASKRLKRLAPFCKIAGHAVAINESNASDLIKDYDVVLDCTDNFYTKFLIHDACFKEKKVLVQASVYQYEGQIQLFDFTNQEGPCLRCLWPTPPVDGCTGTCAQVGVMGPLLGVMGSMQAMEALKVVVDKPHLKNGQTFFVDLTYLSFDQRRFKQRSDCECCVKKEFKQEEVLQIQLPKNLSDYIVMDVRSPQEFEECSFIQQINKEQQVINVPLDEVTNFEPITNKKYLVICAKGIRSLKAANLLRQKHTQVFSLIGGVQGGVL